MSLALSEWKFYVILRKSLKLNTNKLANDFTHTDGFIHHFPNDADSKFQQPRKGDIITWTEIWKRYSHVVQCYTKSRVKQILGFLFCYLFACF